MPLKNNTIMKDYKLMPFDLEAAKAGAKVCTRLGFRVTIVDFNWKWSSKDESMVICAIVQFGNEMSAETFTKEGKHLRGKDSSLDLFMMVEEEKKKRVHITFEMPTNEGDAVLEAIKRYCERKGFEYLVEWV